MSTKTSLALIAALVLTSAASAFARSDRQNEVAPTSVRDLAPRRPGCNATYEGFPLCQWYTSSPWP
jgi:hypothetical protein